MEEKNKRFLSKLPDFESFDPALAEVLYLLLNHIVQTRGINTKDIVEVSAFASIKNLYKNPRDVENRSIDSIIKNSQRIFNNSDTEEKLKELILTLEQFKFVFLHFSESENEFFDEFQELLIQFLKLDFSSRIEPMEIAGSGRNILSFLTYSVNSIINKVSDSMLSKKMADNIAMDTESYDLIIGVTSKGNVCYTFDRFKMLALDHSELYDITLEDVFEDDDYVKNKIDSNSDDPQSIDLLIKCVDRLQSFDFTFEKVKSEFNTSDEIDEFIFKGNLAKLR